MGHWAQHAVDRLQAGEQATVTPHGNSMRPKIISGAKVTLDPVAVADLDVGDVVLCRVRGAVYLHLVRAIRGGNEALIGNNRGGINGWTRTVYGRAVRIENP